MTDSEQVMQRFIDTGMMPNGDGPAQVFMQAFDDDLVRDIVRTHFHGGNDAARRRAADQLANRIHDAANRIIDEWENEK